MLLRMNVLHRAIHNTLASPEWLDVFVSLRKQPQRLPACNRHAEPTTSCNCLQDIPG